MARSPNRVDWNAPWVNTGDVGDQHATADLQCAFCARTLAQNVGEIAALLKASGIDVGNVVADRNGVPLRAQTAYASVECTVETHILPC
jgi:hypothetical protein